METHRCEKSLRNKVSIRKDYRHKFIKLDNDIKKWRLFHYDYNYDYDSINPVCIADIEYCPFCGIKLES